MPNPDPVEEAALADDYWAYVHRMDADTALWSGDVAHLERWPEVSEEGEALHRERLLWYAEQATNLPGGSVTAETVAFTARSAADQLTWQAELRRPNPVIGAVSTMLVFLGRFPLVTSDDGDRYLEKLAGLPRYLADLTTRLGVGATQGRTPILTHVEAAVEQLDTYLRSPLDGDPILAQAAPTDLDSGDATAWREAVEVSVRTLVRPAMAQYREALATSTMPAARPDTRPGLVHLEGGSQLYDRFLHGNTSLSLSADEVHAIGVEQVRRIEEEFVATAGPLVGTTQISEIFQILREEPALHYTDAQELVADARAALDRAQRQAPRWFATTPKAPCVAQEITAGALAFYSPPSDDGSQPGTFFFNVGDPSAWGTFQLQAIAYHEGVPGHHFQVSRALETDGLHPVHTKIFLPAYGEGWGLYTERLADEMGLYTTEWDRVGMLTADVMRACRLVVDTGLHALGWSRQQAIDYLLSHSPLAPQMAEPEVDRYIGMPGQATSYMIGRLEIDDIRAEAEAMAGDRFDIAGFHDVVLGHGSVPLPTLRRRVEAWAAERT